jgi:hypothetical protein
MAGSKDTVNDNNLHINRNRIVACLGYTLCCPMLHPSVLGLPVPRCFMVSFPAKLRNRTKNVHC